MSDLENRRESPRRRIRNRGMHPGWYLFICAYGSGIFTMTAMAFTVRWSMGWDRLWYVIVTVTISLILFIMAGKKAERLDDVR